MGLFGKMFGSKPEPPPRRQSRGFLPDGLTDREVILMKGCTELGLTNEVRLASSVALKTNRTLKIIVQPRVKLSNSLQVFASANGIVIEQKQ